MSLAMVTDRFPKRIVCLTEETTETLYLLGADDRIVGISGFTMRPPHARKEKPMVSAFTTADLSKILACKPRHRFEKRRMIFYRVESSHQANQNCVVVDSPCFPKGLSRFSVRLEALSVNATMDHLAFQGRESLRQMRIQSDESNLVLFEDRII